MGNMCANAGVGLSWIEGIVGSRDPNFVGSMACAARSAPYVRQIDLAFNQGVDALSDTSDLKKEIETLEDDTLQKLFSALFDDGQGGNARKAFVRYCRSRNYHPSEMYILCGGNMFMRLRNMIKRQEKLLDEYRDANRYLFERARQ